MSIAELVARDGAVGDDCARSAVDVPSAEGQATDEELLRRFVAERNDFAFGELVTRHASLVMGVCRRAWEMSKMLKMRFKRHSWYWLGELHRCGEARRLPPGCTRPHTALHYGRGPNVFDARSCRLRPKP